MSKKLITACLGLFALAAFVLPSIAAASPVLTHPTGTVLPIESGGVKTKITGTNIGVFKLKTDPSGTTTPATLTECSTAKITGELTKNSGTLIESTITTATISGSGSELSGMKECPGASGIFGNFIFTTNGGGTDGENVTSGTPWCLRVAGTEDKFTLRGGKCTEESRKITLVMDATKLFEPPKFNECKYERSTGLEGAVTTDTTGDAILSMAPGTTEAEKARTTFKGEAGNVIECPSTFTLETAFTLETDKETAEPLYIS